MNLQGPISQKQFLYVGYTHLEWLLVPPPWGFSTPHRSWRWPMKYRTPFVGHMLFIYFYLSPVALFLSPPMSKVFVSLILVDFFPFWLVLFSSRRAGVGKWKRDRLLRHIPYFFFQLVALSLSLSRWTGALTLFPLPRGLQGRTECVKVHINTCGGIKAYCILYI